MEFVVMVCFICFYYWGGTESLGIYSSPSVSKSLVLRPLWPIVQTPDDRWGWFLEQLVEWRLAGETEVRGGILPQRHFVHHKIPHDQTRARTPDRSGGKPATNRLSYGAAFIYSISQALKWTNQRYWSVVYKTNYINVYFV
jgi:hypothetical protein